MTVETPLRGCGLRREFRQGETDIVAVNGVDFYASHAEFVAIMGPSGSGKSTLLHLLGALDRPDAGTVFLEGEEISSLPERELALVRRRRLGFVLQFFSLLSTMSAAENVAFPLALDGARDPMRRALEALAEVGLEGRADHRPSQLSGGEQQRVALARALVTKPAVVLADEPTGSLDSASSQEMIMLLKQIAERGRTVVIVTHDPSVSAYADRVVQLVDGRVVEDPHTPNSAVGSDGAEQSHDAERSHDSELVDMPYPILTDQVSRPANAPLS